MIALAFWVGLTAVLGGFALWSASRDRRQYRAWTDTTAALKKKNGWYL